jgi:tetratricopeptide (TPR) repeat protein
MAYEKKGLLEQAFVDYDRAVKRDPDSAWGHNGRGYIHYEMGRYDDALADLDRAVELGLTDALVYINRGLAHEAQGKDEPAIRDYREALRINPDSEAARDGLARLGVTP